MPTPPASDQSDSPPAQPSAAKLWARRAGQALTVLALGFLAFEIWRNRAAFGDWTPSLANIAQLAGLAAVYGLSLMLLAGNWRMIVAALAPTPLPRAVVLRSYTMSQIGKYIPGNVAHLVGRHLLLARVGLGHKPLLLATLIEFLILPLSATLVALGCLWMIRPPSDIALLSTALSAAPWALGAAALAWGGLVLTCALHPAARRWLRPAALTLPLACVFMALLGGIFALILTMLTPASVLAAIGAATLGWLVGFATPGSPGGIGTREATVLLLMRGQAEEAPLLLALALFRVVTVLGDLVCYAIGEAAFRTRNETA